MPDVEQNAKKAWKEIVNQRTVLPTPLIRLFNENGDFMGTRKFGDTGKVPENTSRHFPELTEEEYTAIFTQPQVEAPTESTSQPCVQHENRTETNIDRHTEIMDSSQTPHTHHTHHLRPTNLFTATTESVGSNEGTELEFATEDLPPENILQLTLQHQTVEEVHSLSTKRLNTTAGRLIKAIIGRTQEVQAFDELRSYKNQNTVPTGSEKSTYNTLLQN